VVQLRNHTADALAELVDDEAPKPLVDQDLQHRLDDLFGRLQAQGVSPDRYLASLEGGPDTFLEDMRAASTRAVKANLALRAIVVEQELEVTTWSPTVVEQTSRGERTSTCTRGC
jgi:FKBP-type peptidyl-prolyl cis-trans isomerase (trigger factor)